MMDSAALRRMVLRKKLGAVTSPAPSVVSSISSVDAQGDTRLEETNRSGKDDFLENVSLLWKGSHSYRAGREIEQHLKLKVADTVIFEHGKPKSWYFTSNKTHKVLKKLADNVNMNAIIKTFGQKAEQLYWMHKSANDSSEATREGPRHQGSRKHQRGDSDQYVAVARYHVPGRGHMRVEFLRAHQLLGLLETNMQHLVALQTCATLQPSSCVYSTTFKLALNGISIEFETNRLTMDRAIDGCKDMIKEAYNEELKKLLPKKSQRRNVYVKDDEVKIKSKATILNKELEKLTLQIVRFIEATRPSCLIDSLRAEFICIGDAEPTLTHISDVVFRKPIVRRLESLSARSEDSESVGSMFSSRSSQSHNENPLSASQQQPQNNNQQEENQEDKIRQQVRNIVVGPGNIKESNLLKNRSTGFRNVKRCWGQYCSSLSCHIGSKKKGSSPLEKKSVLLLAVLQASIQGVHVALNPESGFHSTNSVNSVEAVDCGAPAYVIQKVENPVRVAASQVAEEYQISTTRLYSPVDVCDICYIVYQLIERTRPHWQLEDENLQSRSLAEVSKAFEGLASSSNNRNKTQKKKEEKAILARCFFCGINRTHEEGCKCCSDTTKADAAKEHHSKIPTHPREKKHTNLHQEMRNALAFNGNNNNNNNHNSKKPQLAPLPKTMDKSTKKLPPPIAKLPSTTVFEPPVSMNSKTATVAMVSLPKKKTTAELNEIKTHRVAQLHSKLSTKLSNTIIHDDDQKIVHPPLFALRRKTFIPAQKVD